MVHPRLGEPWAELSDHPPAETKGEGATPGVEQAIRGKGHATVPYIAQSIVQQLIKMSDISLADTLRRGRALARERDKKDA